MRPLLDVPKLFGPLANLTEVTQTSEAGTDAGRSATTPSTTDLHQAVRNSLDDVAAPMLIGTYVLLVIFEEAR